jgi:hypothetical protein
MTCGGLKYKRTIDHIPAKSQEESGNGRFDFYWNYPVIFHGELGVYPKL